MKMFTTKRNQLGHRCIRKRNIFRDAVAQCNLNLIYIQIINKRNGYKKKC